MIQANELSFMDFFNYYEQDGESFLKEQKMIITSADAWGLLRKDLIDTLGVERAKRFLLRYGRHCGKVEAQMLRDMFDWKDDLEWLLAGTKMHKITGRTFSSLIKFDADFKEARFDVEGYWIDSYEAKQHLQHYSYYHEPVCFFLVGWAGGYCSECLGKPVYFKEVQCMGKGDKHCTYVGKTLEQWGDEINDDLFDYEDNLSDELDRVYRRVEKQKEALKHGSAISQKLTKALLQGKRLNVFGEIINEEMRCSVIIENQQLDVIASTEGGIENSGLTLAYLQSIIHTDEVTLDREKLYKEHRTVKYDYDGGKVKVYFLVSPIVIRKQVYGFITLCRTSHPFEDVEEDILERIATICAVHMLNEQTALETEQRLKGELLEELFNEKGDASIVATKLASLGYNIKTPHYVLVFDIDEHIANSDLKIMQDEDRYMHLRNKITEKLRKEIEQEGYRALISTKLNHIHTIVSQDMIEKKNMNIKRFADLFLQFVDDDIKKKNVKLFIGVSTLCSNYKQLYKRFHEANKAIEIAKMKAKESTIILASDLGHLTLLLDARNPKELEEFADDKLIILYDYDQANQSEFLKTLYYYIQCECNLYKTAREMNVSISGMRYRIKRIQELLDMDLSTSSTRFEIQLALEIFLVFGKLDL